MTATVKEKTAYTPPPRVQKAWWFSKRYVLLPSYLNMREIQDEDTLTTRVGPIDVSVRDTSDAFIRTHLG